MMASISALKFDAVVIGGGPAGASCALWLKLLGFSPTIIEERSRLGGLQNDSPYQNDWITPLVGLSGREVTTTFTIILYPVT
jgi:thioredoxin reductase (NADPH)